MIEKLKQKLSGFRKVAGIEVVIQPDGNYIFNLVLLVKEKGLVNSGLVQPGINSIQDLKKLISVEVPLAVTFSGKGVLLKKVSREVYSANGFSALLPNAREEDFLISVTETNSDPDIFSLVRVSTIMPVLDALRSEGYLVVSASAGAYPFGKIAGLTETDEIAGSAYKALYSESKLNEILVHYEEDEKPVNIAGISLPDKAVPAFAAALMVFMEPSGKNPLSMLDQDVAVWKEKAVYTVAVRSALAIISFTVILNLVLFFYYNSKNSELISQNKSLLGEMQAFEVLSKKISGKEKFLADAGWMGPARISRYSDQLAITVPNTVLLTEMSINPLNENESRKEKKLLFETGRIIIKGECKDPVVLNPWIHEIKKLPWVRKVSSNKYLYDHKEKMGSFEIEVEVKEDV